MLELASRPFTIGAGALFGALAAVRRRRALHPLGPAFHAVFRPRTGTAVGAEVIDGGRERPALVRFSRGFGFRDGRPDILGLAIKVLDPYGPGTEQDLLLSSSGEAVGARNLLRFAHGYAERPYSSVLPFTIGAGPGLLGADVAADPAPGVGLVVRVATPTGAWRPVADVVLGAALGEAEAEALRFNLDRGGHGIEPLGLPARMRIAAYRASQAVRPTPTPSGPASSASSTRPAPAAPR